MNTHKVTIYDKTFDTPRLVGFYSDESDGYKFSKNKIKSFPLTPIMTDILNRVNEQTECKFNAILINLYRNGHDYIGAHSDDEKTLGTDGVVTISMGASRKFRIRNKTTKEIIHEVDTEDVQLLFMKGRKFQSLYTHENPKQLKVKDARISLTFRYHHE